MHSFLDGTFVFSSEHYICFGQLHANVSTSHNSRRPDLPKSHDYSSSLVTTRSIQVPYHLPRPLQDQIVAAAYRPPPAAHRAPPTSPEASDGSGVVAAYYARQRAAAPVAAIERHTSTSSVGRTIRVEHWAATADDRRLRDHSSF